jgi:autotransporter-associated beta strand protein
LSGASTLTVGSFTKFTAGASVALNLNGGTLAAGGSNANFLPALAGLTANVQAGGAVINDGGFAITVAQALTTDPALGATPDGGLIKNGAGTLVLSGANTYTGNTTINAGNLSVASDTPLGAAANSIVLNGGSLQVDGVAYATTAHSVSLSAIGGGVNVTDPTGVFTINNALSGGGLSKFGPGKLVLPQNYTTTSATVVAAGLLELDGAANTSGVVSGAGNLLVTGGTKAAPGLVSGEIQVNNLTVNGAVKIASAGGTSLLNSLTLAGSSNSWTGSFDLNGNKLIVEDAATKAASIATLQNEVLFGKTNNFGIASTGMPASYGIAVIDNAALGTPFTSFGLTPVDTNSILVSAELLGDANADGHVDLTDLSTVLNNFGVATTAWTKGNFDGASTIDLTDLSDVLNNFGLTNPNASDASFGAAVALATPEPTSLALLGLGAAGLIARRRKN